MGVQHVRDAVRGTKGHQGAIEVPEGPHAEAGQVTAAQHLIPAIGVRVKVGSTHRAPPTV